MGHNRSMPLRRADCAAYRLPYPRTAALARRALISSRLTPPSRSSSRVERPGSLSFAAGRAADLLKGGRVDPTQPGPAIKAIDQELDILRGAIIEKTRALDEIARDLAYTESQKLVPEFSEAMRGALAAMEALARAFGAAAGLADQLHRAGYRPSAVLLPDLTPIAARALGDPESQVSEAYKFRRDLEELGVV